MEYILVACIGLALGGVVNALADDLPAGRRLGAPKYSNGSARPPLAWLGITAFLFRRSRAPAAGLESARAEYGLRPRMSWRYPLVECALAGLMTLTFAVARELHSPPAERIVIWQTQVFLFVLLAVIDVERRRIQIEPLLASGLLAVISAFAFPQSPPSGAMILAGALSACLTFSLVYVGGRLFARLANLRWGMPADRVVFGAGDVYLMTVGGLILGFPAVWIAIALSILLGGGGALCFCAIKRAMGRYRRFSTISYGPAILLSVYLVMLSNGEASRLIFGV